MTGRQVRRLHEGWYEGAMGKPYTELDANLQRFIRAQHVFFVATAPSGAEGHVNVSPKGLDCLAIFGPHEVGYADFVGSGAETIAHLRQNQRICMMFCAFDGPPKILRLHGQGEVIEPGDAQFNELSTSFATERLPYVRSIIRVNVTRIHDACGFAVPLMQFEGERRQLQDFGERKGAEGLHEYQVEKNSHSIDGLPALRWPASN
jgi:hypothetical protein